MTARTRGVLALLGVVLPACCLSVVSGSEHNQFTSGDSSGGGEISGGSSSGGSSFPALTVVATGQSGACGICVDTRNLYWQTTTAISKLPLSGGTPTVLAGQLPAPTQIACDGTNVYWNDDHYPYTVNSVSTEGGTSNQLTTSPEEPMAIAVQNGQVFLGTKQGSIFTVPSVGGDRNEILVGDGADIWSIWPTPTLLLFTDYTSGEVRTTPLGGNTWKTLGQSTGGGGDLAANGSSVFWSCGEAGGSLNEVPESGGVSKVVETGQNGIIGVAVDDENVYWVNLFDGRVGKMSLSSGVTTIIASGRNGPCMIALSDTTVYWTETGSGLVMAAPK